MSAEQFDQIESSNAYAEWLNTEDVEAPPMTRVDEDPDGDDGDDIDDDGDDPEPGEGAHTSEPEHQAFREGPHGDDSNKFNRKGILAIESKAMDEDWMFAQPHQCEPEIKTEAAIVTIRGPLVHHPDMRFDSYDAILPRFEKAFQSSAPGVLLSGDSPGGEVSGCFDTAETLRAMRMKYNKPLIGYVDGQCSSAMYALLCACDRIVIPKEGVAGSIGVFAQMESRARLIRSMGIDVEMVASGDRKLDGNPNVAITEEAVANVRSGVTLQAAVFIDWVAQRRALAFETIKAFEGRSYHGKEAVGVGLADTIGTFVDALAMVAEASVSNAASSGETEGSSMSHLRKMLLDEAAEDTDNGRRAKKALEAYDAKEEPTEEEKPKDHEEPDGDEPNPEGRRAEDDSDARRATSRRATSAEDESDESKRADAEDSEGRKAEDEARRAEDDAGDEDAKALRASSLAETKAHVERAARLRATACAKREYATRCRKDAKLYRAMAKSNSLALETKSLVRKALSGAGNPAAAAAAIGATGTRGRTEGTEAKVININSSSETPDLSIFSEAELSALNLGVKSTGLIDIGGGKKELGLLSPAQAKAIVDATEARVASLRGGK